VHLLTAEDEKQQQLDEMSSAFDLDLSSDDDDEEEDIIAEDMQSHQPYVVA
jgi:hypothetical protein